MKKEKEKKKRRSKNFFMFFNLFFILQLVLPKSNPASKNLNPSQEHQRKEKTNYHLSLFHWWTRVLPFIPNKNNSFGLKTQTTWPLKIKINSHGLKTQTAWPTRQTPAKPNKTQTEWLIWSIWRRAPLLQWWRWTRWGRRRRERSIWPTTHRRSDPKSPRSSFIMVEMVVEADLTHHALPASSHSLSL